jgi:hypothetical protein
MMRLKIFWELAWWAVVQAWYDSGLAYDFYKQKVAKPKVDEADIFAEPEPKKVIKKKPKYPYTD